MSLVLEHTKGICLLHDSGDGSPLTPTPWAQMSRLSTSVSWGQSLCNSGLALVQRQCEEQIKPIISMLEGSQIDFYTVGLRCKKIIYFAKVCKCFKEER